MKLSGCSLSDILIRKIDDTEIKTATKLVTEGLLDSFYNTAYSYEDLFKITRTRILTATCRLVAVEQKSGELVGFVLLEPSCSDGFWDRLNRHPVEEIGALVVAEPWRNKGLGSKLKRAVIENSTQHLVAATYTSNKLSAAVFKGWEPIGTYVNSFSLEVDTWEQHVYAKQCC